MRWKAELPYLLPALLLNPLLYWHGYRCWFQQDDFAWLGLLQMLHSAADLPRLLFEPMAQGTIRPVSERGFFLLFRWLFDLNGAPYHALVFATQTANLALLYALVRRLGGAPLTAGLAAVLWCSNNVLYWPLSWVSAYNQVLISCCFLAGANAFVRGRMLLTWAIFLFGFGVLESNVVFPGLLLAYALLFARDRTKQAAWMLLPAIAFAVVNALVVKKPEGGTYAVRLGLEMLQTLARYWQMAVWPAETRLLTGLPRELALVPALLVAGMLAWRLLRRDRLAAFGVAWFLVSLSLYTVLPNHVSEYYLTAPAIGLAIALAAALVALPRPAAAAMLLLLLPVPWFVTWKSTYRARARSEAWENIMQGTEEIARRHPGRAIYLEGIGTDLFVQGFTDSPFRLIGVKNVWLTPHEAAEIDIANWLPSIEPYTQPAQVALRSLESGGAHVFRFEGERFRNITDAYRTRLSQMAAAEGAPRAVTLSDAAYAFLLGPGWFDAEDGFRWMGKSARVTLGGPAKTGARLVVHGFCAPAQLAAGPLALTIRADGLERSFEIHSCAAPFEFTAPLPAALTGAARWELTLEASRAAPVPPDTRSLGFAIQSVEVR